MLDLLLIRTKTGDDGTFGVLLLADTLTQVCAVAELPWRDNQPGKSCIQADRYYVEYMPQSSSGRFRDCYHVLDVPGRSGILFHAGNLVGNKDLGLRSDSYGCLLPCLRIGELRGQVAGLSSRAAMVRIHSITGRKSFNLEIRWGL